MTPDHDPDPRENATYRPYPPTVDLNELIKFAGANLPRHWHLTLEASSIEVDLALTNPVGDWVEVVTDDMNTVEAYIEHINYARRACGLAEAVFSQGEGTTP